MKRLKRILSLAVGAAALGAATAALAIEPTDQESLRNDCIRPLVWAGFKTRDYIFEAALAHLGDPKLKRAEIAWIKAEIQRQWKEKKAAEATWPATTDFDRLDTVFRSLEKAGILALHDAGVTQSDAISDAAELWQARGGSKSGLRGYVFYHGQDVERAVADGTLYLGFGTFDGSIGTAMDIAAEATSALANSGFKVTEPADAGRRILLSGLDWKKRSPN